jgi:peptide/nickel transport system permease protein
MTFLKSVICTAEGAAGLLLLCLLAAIALSATLISPGDPLNIAGPPLVEPFTLADLPLGTDTLGRDVLAGIVHGTRTSMVVGLAAAAAAMTVGVCIGLAAGFSGGRLDETLMRLTDAFQIVPGFLMALAFVSVSGASLPVIIVAIALGAWAGPARLTRAQVLSIRERDYVSAARVIGMHPAEIAFKEILPNALPPVLALSAIIVAGAILTESALSFLGLGDPNVVTWGSMISEGRNVLRSAPWLSILPGIALLLTVIAVYLLGEGVTKALASVDTPRTRTDSPKVRP